MFGYRRKSFRKAAAMLSTIRKEPADLKTLFALQKLLIAEITLAERRVRENKARANAEQGNRSAYYEKRAQAHRQSIYYWKAFGDAIAFLYCDRFALKHVYYNTHNGNVRQDGGFISGSAGFEQEFDTLRKLVEGGYPCVLCDLTNTIRYGDVCVMVEDDPILIEVKASGTKNQRRARQLRNLKTLREFYRTDASSGLRGFPSIYRMATRSVPHSFEEELNECIEESYERDYALKSPEPGVCYVAISGDVRVEEVSSQLSLAEPLLFSLNETRRDRAWSPYYPFTLLIRSERALYDFMLGRLIVMVLLDVAVIRDLVRTMGWIPKFDLESDYPVWASRNGGEEQAGLSGHALTRAAMEALSLKWVVEEGIRELEPSGRLPDKAVEIPTPGRCRGWSGGTGCATLERPGCGHQ